MKVRVTSNGISVEVTRDLIVGTWVNIHPSDVYQGIERGSVRILSVGTIQELDHPYTKAEVLNDIREFISMESDVLGEDKSQGDLEYLDSLNNNPWVIYEYGNHEVCVLPLEHFLNHTTIH